MTVSTDYFFLGFILVLTVVCMGLIFLLVFTLQFDKVRPEIQDLYHNFLEISVLDYREVILPLAKSFLWVCLHLEFLVYV